MNHTNMHMHTLPVYALNFEILKFFSSSETRMEKQETENWNGHGNGRRKRK